jgi:two-component system cell cycle response regulator
MNLMAAAGKLSRADELLLTEGGRSRRAVLWILGASAALTALYAVAAAVAPGDQQLFRAGGIDVPPGDAAYQLVLLAATGLCVARVVLRAEDRLAWALLTLGMIGWSSAELVSQFGGEQLTYPSAADALYLSDYPLTIAGLLLLLKGRLTAGDPRRWLDGLIAGTAGASLAFALLSPALEGLAVTDTAKTLTNLSYPALDILLVSFLFAAIGVVGRALDRSLVILLAAFALSAVGDAAFLYLDATSSYVNGSLIDPLWMISATLTGLAAWTRPEPAFVSRLPVVALTVPTLLALGAVVTALAIDDSGSPVAIYLAIGTMAAVVGRLIVALLDNERLLGLTRSEAHTDALTGLANRRRLNEDLIALEREIGDAKSQALLAVYDLDGFKSYNDSFGHAAGDDVLRRMGANLSDAVGDRARAYRLGGDEFCVIVEPRETGRMEPVVAAATAALVEQGQGFEITSSVGVCRLPGDTADPSDALRIADGRMYANKGRRGGLPVQQAGDLLMQVLRERQPELGGHSRSVSDLAADLARASGLGGEELELTVRCAELHDVGKMAIPDAILEKPGPLSSEEWALIRKHTLIGERILAASPSLAGVGKLVRSTHERWDGGGYPDGLVREEIPLGARITVICDAFESITAERPYDSSRSFEEAIAELRRGAGTQFDPVLVERFCSIVSEQSQRA